jgi:integrase
VAGFARGYAAANPVAGSIRPKVPPKAPGILSVAQARSLLEACPREIVAAVAIGLFAGLRQSEIERLEWKDVDLERGFIHVSAQNSKTAQRRLVTVSENLRSWLANGSTSNHSGPVCPANYRLLFHKAQQAAGIAPWPKNALRHSFASYHLAAYQNAAGTALQLGHMDARVLFAHYRELVTPDDARNFWQIFFPLRAAMR